MSAPACRIRLVVAVGVLAVTGDGGPTQYIFDSAADPLRRVWLRSPNRRQHLEYMRRVDVGNRHLADDRRNVLLQARRPLRGVHRIRPGIAVLGDIDLSRLVERHDNGTGSEIASALGVAFPDRIFAFSHQAAVLAGEIARFCRADVLDWTEAHITCRMSVAEPIAEDPGATHIVVVAKRCLHIKAAAVAQQERGARLALVGATRYPARRPGGIDSASAESRQRAGHFCKTVRPTPGAHNGTHSGAPTVAPVCNRAQLFRLQEYLFNRYFPPRTPAH